MTKLLGSDGIVDVDDILFCGLMGLLINDQNIVIPWGSSVGCEGQ